MSMLGYKETFQRLVSPLSELITLTQLITRENCIAFIRCKNFKSCIGSLFTLDDIEKNTKCSAWLHCSSLQTGMLSADISVNQHAGNFEHT
jgi:hypothetical protein